MTLVKLWRYPKLFWLFLRVSIQYDAAYRVDFFVNLAQAMMQLGGELVALWTIFSNTRSLAGWNVLELLALLGVFRIMAGAIGLIIAPSMRMMMEDIRDGGLDFLVLKPASTQFLVSTRRVIIWRAMDVVLGFMVAMVASVSLGRTFPAAAVLQFLVMIACGLTIIYSFWLALATLAFWLTRISNIEMVFWNVFEAGRYPVDIYRTPIRLGLTYIIPLAFLTTFPAEVLLGRPGSLGVITAVLVAGLSLTAASSFFRFGLRCYSGASA